MGKLCGDIDKYANNQVKFLENDEMCFRIRVGSESHLYKKQN